MANLRSRKALYNDLTKLAGVILPKDYKSLANEVYGPKAMIYVDCASRAARDQVEAALIHKGYPVQTDYDPAGRTTAVRVSYFKGHHWDE